MRRVGNVKNNDLSLIERSAAQRTCTGMKRKTANIDIRVEPRLVKADPGQ
jgi:hypothetical protein